MGGVVGCFRGEGVWGLVGVCCGWGWWGGGAVFFFGGGGAGGFWGCFLVGCFVLGVGAASCGNENTILSIDSLLPFERAPCISSSFGEKPFSNSDSSLIFFSGPPSCSLLAENSFCHRTGGSC